MKLRIKSGGDAAALALALGLDDLHRRLLATATAGSNRQLALHGRQRVRAPKNGFADLTIRDGMAKANVHGSSGVV